MANSKLTANLTLAAIAIKYDVNAHGVDNLKTAIENGEILGMLKACADELYGGDMKPVMAQFNRNLSSQRCTRKITDTASKNRADMVELLWAMTHGTKVGAPKAPRAGFQYTIEEVDALAAEGNVAELQRLYNNVHSNVNKKLAGEHPSNWPTRFAEDPVLARWVKVKEHVSEVLPKVKARAKASKPAEETSTKPEVSDDLAKKLANYKAGKKATFTPEQMAEIVKLLQG